MRSTTRAAAPAKSLVTLHDLASHKRQTSWVSPYSAWSDARWYFLDPARDGYVHGAAVWDFEFPDGSNFLEPRFDTLRESVKILLCCLHKFRSMGTPLKPATLNEVSIGVRYFLRWMVGAGYTALGEVDSIALEAFEEYLVTDKLNEDLDENLTASSLARYLRAPFALWEERHRLEAAGLPTLPGLPFPGETHHTLGTRLARVALGRIAPIPKEILIPAMNAAERFIEGPAADVVEMVRFFGREVPDVLADTRDGATRAQLGRYLGRRVTFREVNGQPWHAPLHVPSKRIGVKNLAEKTTSGMELAKDLVDDTQAAASILLQGAAGLRVSEIELLEADRSDPKTGLPNCVEIRFDDTGTIELFYVKGWLIKTTKSKEAAEWLVGARVVGSDTLPPPVLALSRLYDLASVVDAANCSGRLFVGTDGSAWRYFEGQAVPLNGTKIHARQRAFMANYVDRDLLDRLEIVRTHGWRKAFARFVFGFDRLRP